MVFQYFSINYLNTSTHLAGCPGGPDPCPSSMQCICTLKFLNQFGKSALKNQLKKPKNPPKRSTSSILLKFFNATLTSAGQKNAKLIFEKIHLIRKLKFRIFDSMAVILYLSFHMLSIFGSFTIFSFTFFENLKTILLLNLLI